MCPALQSIVLYLLTFPMTMTAMVKPAQAADAIAATATCTIYHSGNRDKGSHNAIMQA